MFRFESKNKNESGPNIELPPFIDISQVGEFLAENASDDGPFNVVFHNIQVNFNSKDSAEEMQAHFNNQYYLQSYNKEFKNLPVLEQSLVLERQPQVDELVDQIDSLDINDNKEVLSWLKQILQTGSKFRIDFQKIENRFKEREMIAGKDTDIDTGKLIEQALIVLLVARGTQNRDEVISSIDAKLAELG